MLIDPLLIFVAGILFFSFISCAIFPKHKGILFLTTLAVANSLMFATCYGQKDSDFFSSDYQFAAYTIFWLFLTSFFVLICYAVSILTIKAMFSRFGRAKQHQA